VVVAVVVFRLYFFYLVQGYTHSPNMSSRPELKVSSLLLHSCCCLSLEFPVLKHRRSISLTRLRQVDDEHGFIRYFKSLPAVGDETVRIFDRGDWYTAHGDDANFIARTVRNQAPFNMTSTCANTAK